MRRKNSKAQTKTNLGPGLVNVFRRRPTLPPGRPSSTIGAEELNFRVRDGNGCFLSAIAAEKFMSLAINQDCFVNDMFYEFVNLQYFIEKVLWSSRTTD